MRILAAALALGLASPAQAGPLGSEASLGLTFSDHGSTCHGCNERHLDVKLTWEGALAPWADLDAALLYPNSKGNPSLFLGARVHRELPLGLEAFVRVGLVTGYDRLLGVPIGPMALPGISGEGWELSVAPLVKSGGGIEPFFALRVTILEW